MIIKYLLLAASMSLLIMQASGASATQMIEGSAIAAQAHRMSVQSEAIASRYVTSGAVTSDHRVSISSRISGYIRQLSVREGDYVKKEQVLVRVDPVNARQSLVQAQADMADAGADLKRYEELFAARAVSRQQLDRVRLRYKVAKSQMEQARHQLGYAEVRSPVDGIVVEKRLSKGDLASPGAVILTIEDPTSLLVETYVSEQFVSGIHAGDQVEVEIASLQRRLTGMVRQVVQAADAVSHQFLIKIALPDDKDVHPGMFAQVGFRIGDRRALMIPVVAVVERAGLKGVYIVDAKGVAHYRQIRIGLKRDGRIEVLVGLHDGDVIAWGGNPPLRTGMKTQTK